MEKNKKFNFVLVGYTRKTVQLANLINAYAVDDFFCDGIEEFSLDESRVDAILGKRAYSGGDIPESLIEEVESKTIDQEFFTYKYFFYRDDFEKNSHEFVFFVKENYPELSLHVDQKNFEDWNEEWKKFYVPIAISKNIEIIPEWMKDAYISSAKTKVFIYPGMGFGTGSHETTFLCLKLFDQEIFKEKIETCLDFGCGSGILGISVMKSKKIMAHFCDIDKHALENCLQNVLLNFEGQDLLGTELLSREKYHNKGYDLVFANILEHVLVLEKETLLSSLNKGAYLIVSGILNEQVENIIKTYSTLQFKKSIQKGDWSAILFQRIE